MGDQKLSAPCKTHPRPGRHHPIRFAPARPPHAPIADILAEFVSRETGKQEKLKNWKTGKPKNRKTESHHAARKRTLLAFLACLVIAASYGGVLLFTQSVPAASGFYGHTIGIVGFVLMLMTETLYSLRKRSRSARWGRMADWLQFHIFTGIVGPFMVFLHSSWKFNGWRASPCC